MAQLSLRRLAGEDLVQGKASTWAPRIGRLSPRTGLLRDPATQKKVAKRLEPLFAWTWKSTAGEIDISCRASRLHPRPSPHNSLWILSAIALPIN